MKKRLSAFALSGLIALGMLAGSLAPATAGVVNPGTPTVTANNDVVNVRDRHWRRHHRHYRHHRHHRRHYRSGGGIYFQFGSPGYYGPGYYPRYYRPPTYYTRPRYVAPRYVAPAYGLSRAHIRWCYNRYRSYRASDNTFQPYHGPRQQCYSPYR